jgi:uncharacterized protein YggE
MLLRVFVALSVGVGLLCSTKLAQAQNVLGDVVSGTAQARLQPNPTKLRMTMEIRSYGVTVDAAIKNLKLRRAAALAELKKLDADAASIAFSIPRAGAVMPGSQASQPYPGGFATPVAPTDVVPPIASSPEGYAPNYVPAPMPMAAPARGPSARNSAGKAPPPLFTASTALKVEWSLEGRQADEIAAAAAAIRKRVLAADVTGDKQAHELTPEQQELVEESNMVPQNRFSPPMPPSLTPSDGRSSPAFAYVAVLSEEQRKRIKSNAYTQAKKEAEELAEAAGKHLGELANLSCQLQNTSMPGTIYGSYSPENGSSPFTSWEGDNRESVSANPDGLEFRCSVTASYHFLTATASR